MMKIPLIIALVLGVLSILADLLVVQPPVPGQDAAMGFFGCLAIILISKWLGRKVIQRRSDYYEREEEGAGA